MHDLVVGGKFGRRGKKRGMLLLTVLGVSPDLGTSPKKKTGKPKSAKSKWSQKSRKNFSGKKNRPSPYFKFTAENPSRQKERYEEKGSR